MALGCLNRLPLGTARSIAARRSAWRYGGLQLGSALDGPSNLPLGSVPKYFRRLATWLGA
jgi:hypothetical protein